MPSTWRHGVCLGVKGKSGEIVVADENGVWKTRTVQRKPADERWDPKNIDLIKGLPWKTEEEDEPGAPAIAIRMDESKLHEEQTTDAKPAVPRSFYIQARDLETHGYSAGCPGCVSILKRAKHRRPHN